MKKETRAVVYDNKLRIEAYRFKGIVQPFPNHFHAYYVIGFIEDGQRVLSCKNKEYTIEKGNMILFNPGDNHACVQSGDGTFDYRCFNISESIMLELAEEVTGKRELPVFSKNVICDEEITCYPKSKGITPYRYLETIRINEAKALLEKGMQPIDAAMQTGFSDQSHFTNYFNRFIGLAPGVYREIFFGKDKNRE